MTTDLQFGGDFQYLIEEMFKDSAKTSWAKIAIIKRIVFKESMFMPYVCHDHDKAKSHLFDVAIQLQTNKRLIQDFGQLFYEEAMEDTPRHAKKKSIEEFITGNGIKVKAFSTSMSVRGEIHGPFRPDYYTIDDFENDKTKRSIARTTEVKNFIDELFSGVSADAKVVFLCNKISEHGSVAWLENKAKDNKKFKVLKVPLEGPDGEIAWKSRFVRTNDEAYECNRKQPNSKRWVFSIEERRTTLGTSRYNQEYNNKPIAKGTSRIHREWIEERYYKAIPVIEARAWRVVIMMDPNAGETENSDYYGIGVVGYFKGDPHRYILETRREKKASQLKQAADFIKTWQRYRQHCNLAGIEKLMTQVAVYQNVIAWKDGNIDLANYGVNDDNRDIPVIAVSPKGKDKEARMEVHEAEFERGEIHLHFTQTVLAENLIAFPDVEHDDDIDPVMYCLEYTRSRTQTLKDMVAKRDMIKKALPTIDKNPDEFKRTQENRFQSHGLRNATL